MASIHSVHGSILTRNHHPNPSKISIGLDVSEIVLTALVIAAKTSSIPYLQDAAQQALNIVNIVKDVRSHKDSFKRLGNDACELVYAILLTVDESRPTSEALLNNLRELLRKMADIERFAKKETRRSVVLRTIRHKSDFDTIQEYREHLRQSLDVFGLKSSISIQENIALMQKNLDEINEREKRREAAEMAKADKESELARKEVEEKERLTREEEEAKRKRYGEDAAWEQEKERREKERKERERLAYLISQQERLEEKQRLEVIRLEEEKLKESEERIRKEKEMLERIEKEKLERQRERLEQQRIELERLEWLKSQKDKEEKEKAEKERLERLRWEEERYRAEKERVERARQEEEERYRAEKERAERARQEEERAARIARYPTPPTPPFLQSPFPSSYYPPGFDYSFANLNLNPAGVPNPFYNTGVLHNNSGNTTHNITTNSNNDSSVNLGRSKKKKSE